MTVTEERAIELIEDKRLQEKNRIIKTFAEEPELEICNGRFGPYIAYKGSNYKIPKTKDPKALELKDALELIKSQEGKPAKKKPAAKKTAKA
jgi:DNA topoisomerase-1